MATKWRVLAAVILGASLSQLFTTIRAGAGAAFTLADGLYLGGLVLVMGLSVCALVYYHGPQRVRPAVVLCPACFATMELIDLGTGHRGWVCRRDHGNGDYGPLDEFEPYGSRRQIGSSLAT